MAGLGKLWTAPLVLWAALSGSAWGQTIFPPGSGIDLAGGSFILPCSAVIMQGELTLGAGTLDTGSFTFGSGATVTGTGGQLIVGGDLTSTDPLSLNTTNVVLSDACAPGSTLQLSGHITVNDLTLTGVGPTPPTIVLPAGTNLTVLGTLTLGSPGNPVVLTSSGPGIAVVTMGPLATLVNPSGSVVPANVRIGPPPPAPVPTLATYGLMLMSLLLGALAIHRLRRTSLF